MKRIMTIQTTKDEKYEVSRFNERSFSTTILGLAKIEYGAVSYSTEKPVNFSGVDKFQLKPDFFGSIVNGINYSFI